MKNSLILFFSLLLIGCGPSIEERAKEAGEELRNELNEQARLSKQAADSIAWAAGHPIEANQQNGNMRIWRSSETGLPQGTVVKSGADDDNLSSNYIAVCVADGTTVIVKNVDWAIYDAIDAGDIIK